MAAISANDVKALREQTGAGMMDCKRALSEADADVERAIELLRERGLAKAGKRAARETSEGAVAVSLAGSTAGIVELGCETDFVAKTADFQAMAEEIAGIVASDGGPDTLEKTLAAGMRDGTVDECVSAVAAKVGENVQLKRVQRLVVPGGGLTGGYVHMGGRLGVIVALDTGRSDDESLRALAKDLSMHVAAVDPTPIAVDREGVPADIADKERALLRRQAEQSGKPESVIDKIVEGRMGKFYSETCLLEQPFVKDPDQKVADHVKSVASASGAEVSVRAFVRFKLGEATA